jgi:hypothetical protein
MSDHVKTQSAETTKRDQAKGIFEYNRNRALMEQNNVFLNSNNNAHLDRMDQNKTFYAKQVRMCFYYFKIRRKAI